MYWLEDGTAVDAAEMLRLTRQNLDYLQPDDPQRPGQEELLQEILADLLNGPVMYGVYINCDGPEFIDLILSRRKLYETRGRNMLQRLLGHRVALIETRRGRRPLVRGYATIASAELVPDDGSLSATVHRMQAAIYRTPYDIPPGGKKWFYLLKDVTRCAPYPVPAEHENHGRAWTVWTRED